MCQVTLYHVAFFLLGTDTATGQGSYPGCMGYTVTRTVSVAQVSVQHPESSS